MKSTVCVCAPACLVLKASLSAANKQTKALSETHSLVPASRAARMHTLIIRRRKLESKRSRRSRAREDNCVSRRFRWNLNSLSQHPISSLSSGELVWKDTAVIPRGLEREKKTILLFQKKEMAHLKVVLNIITCNLASFYVTPHVATSIWPFSQDKSVRGAFEGKERAAGDGKWA